MTRVLLTAFGPYDQWSENASWLALMRLTADLPEQPTVVTRKYPVDFSTIASHIARDLDTGFDVVLHLGQAPGSAAIHLEAIGLNISGTSDQRPEDFRPLVEGGPAAYRSGLPLSAWAKKLRAAGVPVQVSYHAGTYLCNAALYWTHHLIRERGLRTRAAFIHLPLDISQTADQKREMAALPTDFSARALRLILDEL